MVKHLHQYQTLPLQEMDWDIPMCVAALEYAGLEDIFMSVGGNGLEYVGLEGIIMYIAGLDKNCPMSIARNDLEFAALEDIIIMCIEEIKRNSSMSFARKGLEYASLENTFLYIAGNGMALKKLAEPISNYCTLEGMD